MNPLKIHWLFLQKKIIKGERAHMKIAAYEVREDETEIMKKLAGKLGIDELVTTAEPLTLETVHLAEGAAGVTTLGQSIIDEKVC